MKYNTSKSTASDFLEVLTLVRLRFRLSFFPGSHLMPWQLDCTICAWPHLQQPKPWTQQFKHVQPHGQIRQAQFHSVHNVSLRSVSNSTFWMPSRTLLAIIIERHMTTQKLQTIHNIQTGLVSIRFHSKHNVNLAKLSEPSVHDNSVPSCYIRHGPLLNSRLKLELRLHYVRKCPQHPVLPRDEWTSSRPKRSTEKITDYSLSPLQEMPLDASKFPGETLLLWVHSSKIIGVLEHHIPQWGERGGSRSGVMLPCWRDIPHTACAFI